MAEKIKLTIAYDGTDFHGFQVQLAPPVRTVQGVLEEVLGSICAKEVAVTGAGRTDSGVHARAQVVTFETSGKMPAERWSRVLNHRLPRDIVVRQAEVVPEAFHPRFDAREKVYRYTLETAALPDVFTRRYYTHLPRTLDVAAMRAAAQHLIGTHDFTSFSAAQAQVKDRVRHLQSIEICTSGTRIQLWFVGNGFLQYMVRILTGTLVAVGAGELSPDAIPHILAARDRRLAGRTMPPEGLTLWEVVYE
ncbi:tRNA pseudouridine(38-40) synthase TruA [Numidum massiliense]|uniref:tRNA pseudouridine(38-40) synthase TruA n=1 Tax=Numidum massiliense TaxID=1522315 RepID=UPI0006D56A10|nr:tRNA pseudouridine(38-40) synthase TruA [Numidum massiliense]